MGSAYGRSRQTVRGRELRGTHDGDVRHRPGRPRFSVVLPVRDRADVVGRAVAAVLSQTFVDLELLVVDLGSTDRTLDAVRAAGDERVVVLGDQLAASDDAPVAYTTALAAARGAWISFIDADTEVAPGWLARLGRLIDANAAGFASCGGLQEDGRGGGTEVRPVPGGDGSRACFRPGAFMTTTDRVRTVLELIGPEMVQRCGPRHAGQAPRAGAVDDVGEGCTGHMGRAALDLTLLDGDAVVSSPELLVAWHEPPETERDDATSTVEEVQLRVAFQGLDALARTPIPDGELLARYATAGGLAAARLRQRRDARRLFRIAWRARPDVRDHWSNLVAAHLGPLGQRAWIER